MTTLRDLELFVFTAEAGSLSAAARRLDLTPAAASASLKRLEGELGIRLFVRSTRSQRLTQEGEIYLQHCRQGLQALNDGRQALAAGEHSIRGALLLSVPSDLGRNILLPWLDEFQAQHPALQLRLQSSDRLADVYSQPVDMAVRYGQPADSSLIALPIEPDNFRVLCAAPDYLEHFGRPASPDELVDHNCLSFALSGMIHDRWRFFRDGHESSVQVRGNRSADDGEIVRRWALAGHGIVYKSRLDVARDLQAGRLIALCTDWQGEPAPLNLMCADRRQRMPAVQLLRDFLREKARALIAGL